MFFLWFSSISDDWAGLAGLGWLGWAVGAWEKCEWSRSQEREGVGARGCHNPYLISGLGVQWNHKFLEIRPQFFVKLKKWSPVGWLAGLAGLAGLGWAGLAGSGLAVSGRDGSGRDLKNAKESGLGDAITPT